MRNKKKWYMCRFYIAGAYQNVRSRKIIIATRALMCKAGQKENSLNTDESRLLKKIGNYLF